MECGMKTLLALFAVLAGTVSMTPATAETYGVAFAAPSDRQVGYSAVGIDTENKEVFRVDMTMRWELGFMAILSGTTDLSADEVSRVVAICWGGGDATSQKQGCGLVEWEERWHSVYPLFQGESTTK